MGVTVQGIKNTWTLLRVHKHLPTHRKTFLRPYLPGGKETGENRQRLRPFFRAGSSTDLAGQHSGRRLRSAALFSEGTGGCSTKVNLWLSNCLSRFHKVLRGKAAATYPSVCAHRSGVGTHVLAQTPPQWVCRMWAQIRTVMGGKSRICRRLYSHPPSSVRPQLGHTSQAYTISSLVVACGRVKAWGRFGVAWGEAGWLGLTQAEGCGLAPGGRLPPFLRRSISGRRVCTSCRKNRMSFGLLAYQHQQFFLRKRSQRVHNGNTLMRRKEFHLPEQLRVMVIINRIYPIMHAVLRSGLEEGRHIRKAVEAGALES